MNHGIEHQKAIKEKVTKLLYVGFIQEVPHATWLANLVLVKKLSGRWRMCVDYINLNKACPKYSYPFPNIDHLVDSALGFRMVSFGDAFTGYNQVKMHSNDKDNIAFIINEGVYYYRVMLFRLKNAGATYQRMMNMVFVEQIRRNMEVHVDNILIKSKEPQQHQQDLEETFKTLQQCNMRLNPK